MSHTFTPKSIHFAFHCTSFSLTHFYKGIYTVQSSLNVLLLQRMKRIDEMLSGRLFCCVFIQWFLTKSKACHGHYLMNLAIYLGTLVLDVITIVITNEKIKTSTGKQECQCVSGSLDWKSCHLIHNPEPSPLNLAFCDTVKHTRPSYY